MTWSPVIGGTDGTRGATPHDSQRAKGCLSKHGHWRRLVAGPLGSRQSAGGYASGRYQRNAQSKLNRNHPFF